MGQSNSHSVTRFFQTAKTTDKLEDEFAEMYVEYVSSKCKINPIPVIEKQCHLLRFINIGTHRNPRDDDKICILNDVIWYSNRYSYNEWLYNTDFKLLILILQINGYDDTSSDNVCIVDNYCIGLNCKIRNKALNKITNIKSLSKNSNPYCKMTITDLRQRIEDNENLLKGKLDIVERLKLVKDNENLQSYTKDAYMLQACEKSISNLEQLLERLVCDEKLIV